MRRVRIWENGELPVGFRGCCEWLVVNEAVLLDPFFSQVFGSQSTGRLLVLLKRRSGCWMAHWTADKQPVDLLSSREKWIG
jgi:hypothetical protein